MPEVKTFPCLEASLMVAVGFWTDRPFRYMATIVRRWVRNIDTSGSCWIWAGAKSDVGYGVVGVGKKVVGFHRLMWSAAHRKAIPSGLQVNHSCDNRRCCNPSHLHLGTHKSNAMEMADRGRSTRGEKNPQAKITEALVLEIRESDEPNAVIARRLRLLPGHISAVRLRKRWHHV